jgi:hypothetical protein
MFDWFFGGIWSAFLHWLAYWGAFVAVVGVGVLGFLWLPIGKTACAGIVAGAVVLTALQYGFVQFRQKDPQVCIHPPTDPNGPVCQRWHSTDDQRGFGYWEPCDQ